MGKADKIAPLLIDVEAQLRQLNLWQEELLAADAFSSSEPFSIDTMRFEQWLQFVFLATIYDLLEADQPLPQACGVAPMAQEYFRGLHLASADLEETLLTIDQILNRP